MAHVSGVFHDSLTKSISDSKILMVGAGGIGCELLKNIVLTGLIKVLCLINVGFIYSLINLKALFSSHTKS